MTDMNEQANATLQAEMEGVREELGRLKGNLDRATFAGNSTINVNAGALVGIVGGALAVGAIAACVLLSIMLMDARREFGQTEAELKAEISSVREHQTALYMLAPDIRKMVKEMKEQNE